jgi:pre-mRNA-splicing helicase BRR2
MKVKRKSPDHLNFPIRCTWPNKPDLSGYNYSAISSLVLTADCSQLLRRDREPDGASKSLVRRIDPKLMGDRVQREVPTAELSKKKKVRDEVERAERAAISRKRHNNTVSGFGYLDIVGATQGIEGLTHRPCTMETSQVYELILSMVH